MKSISKSLFPVFIALLFLPRSGFACSCGPKVEAFCPSVSTWSYVVMAEITEYAGPNDRKIHIIDNIRKEVASSEILLIGQDGVNCGEELTKFMLGDTLILALGQITDTSYVLSWCGRNYLQYSSGTVQGPILTEADTSMSYADFVTDIEACVLLVDTKEHTQDIVPARIFPNPCKDVLTVQLNDRGITRIDIYTFNGNLLMSREGNGRREIHLNTQYLAPGIYITQIYYPGGTIRKRLTKLM